MAVVNTGPGWLDWAAYVGGGSLKLTDTPPWSSLSAELCESLSGASLGVLTVSVSGTTVTVTVSGVLAAGHPSGAWWRLKDAGEVVIGGRFRADDLPSSSWREVPVLLAGDVSVTAGATGPAGSGGGGGGGGYGANLTWAASPSGGVVASDSGTDATLTLASGTNAGLMAPAQHTKLAGIETGATADMTAAEILAALLTVDGSGSGLDADTVDGLSSADLVTTSTALGGDLTGTVGNAQIAAGAVGNTEIAANAVGTTQIINGTIVNGDINAAAAIALSKLATDPLARANHTGTQVATTSLSATGTKDSTTFLRGDDTWAVPAGGGGGGGDAPYVGAVSAGQAAVSSSTGWGVPGRSLTGAPVSYTTFPNVQADRLQYVPFFVDAAVTATALSVEVTAGVAGTCRVGIVALNPATGQPSTTGLKYQTTFDPSTTGVKSVTGLSVALAAGPYALLFVCSSLAGFRFQKISTEVGQWGASYPATWMLSKLSVGTSAFADPVPAYTTTSSDPLDVTPVMMRWTA